MQKLQLLEQLLTWPNLTIMLCATVLTGCLKRFLPSWRESPKFQRMLPAFGIVWCSALIWIPGLEPEGLGTGSRIVLGIILGACTANLRQILARFGLGFVFDWLELGGAEARAKRAAAQATPPEVPRGQSF